MAIEGCYPNKEYKRLMVKGYSVNGVAAYYFVKNLERDMNLGLIFAESSLISRNEQKALPPVTLAMKSGASWLPTLH